MEKTEIERTEELLKNLKTDKNAARELFILFRTRMYKEATLYLSDKEEAKNTCIKAFRNSYSALTKAEPDDAEDILIQAVQDECIKNIAFEGSGTYYSADDEVPAANASLPADQKKIYSTLRGILSHLSPSQRLAAVLKFRDGLSFKEMANRLHASESEVKGVVQDAKNSLKSLTADPGIIFALVNKVYPFYEEKTEARVVPVAKDVFESGNYLSDEEEQFNTSVNELKEFFNTKTISMNAISDHGIDDTDENQYDSEPVSTNTDQGKEIDDTASSAKMIMAVAMSAESDKKKHDEKYNPFTYWAKRIAIVLVLFIIGFAGSIGFMSLRSKKNTPAETPEPIPAETAETEEKTEEEIEKTEEPTPEAEETPEPEDTSIGSIQINVTDLSIRTGPGASYEQSGITEYGTNYDVFEITEADGYIWYRVGEAQWVPDLQGQYVIYTSKE